MFGQDTCKHHGTRHLLHYRWLRQHEQDVKPLAMYPTLRATSRLHIRHAVLASQAPCRQHWCDIGVEHSEAGIVKDWTAEQRDFNDMILS